MRANKNYRRRGAAVAMVAVSGTVILGFAALAVDVSMLYRARAEAQRAADAGALAGAWNLIGDERFKGSTAMYTLLNASRQNASSISGMNRIYSLNPVVDLNQANAEGGDIVLGRLDTPSNRSEPLKTNVEAMRWNTTRVLVHRDATRNGPIPLFFAQLFGLGTKNISASAMACAEDAIVGFKNPGTNCTLEILPFTVQVDSWNNLINGVVTNGDEYTYNKTTGAVLEGPDSIKELNIYPGAGGAQLPPGNFGTVDIGSSNNSTSDISRQIRYGISASDLAYFGGELKFDANGKLYLNGDTGLSAAVKDDLTAIIGQPRILPLFSTVSGPGNNATYTIVAWAGVRIVHVKLTGAMNSKAVIVQPACVTQSGAIVKETASSSYGVFRPPTLVR
jgi:hypothetical protein